MTSHGPSWAVLLLVGLLIGIAIPTGTADSRSFAAINIRSAVVTLANGITRTGQIVGFLEYADKRAAHGFVRTPTGVVTIIDVPGASSTAAWGINSGGQIVGSFQDATQTPHGFLRTQTGAFANVDVPSAVATAAIGINYGG